MASRTLHTAVQFDLFTALSGCALTAEQIRKKLDLHPRAVPDFTDALVALGLLSRAGTGPKALYSNTLESATFLDRNSPKYRAGIINHFGLRSYGFWNNLPEALRTGKQQNESQKWNDMFNVLYECEEVTERFVESMISINASSHENFAALFDFKPYKTLADLGGSSGTLCCEVAKANPHMTCTSFDLPPLLNIARRTVQKHGMSDRVTCVAGDFFKDDIPRADIIVTAMVLFTNSQERRKFLMRKAYDALPSGGAFVAIEMLIDDERRERVLALMMSLNMLIEFGDATDYSGKDFEECATEIGFVNVVITEIADYIYMAVAYKP